MPDAPSKYRPRLISLPIFWQVMGLSLIVLVLAVGINTWFVIDAPEPPPSGYRMAEAVAALKHGQARLPDGRWLKAETSDDAPDYVKANPDHAGQEWPFATLIAMHMASDLGVPADRIWVNVQHHRPGALWRRHEHFADDDRGPGWPGSADGAGFTGVAPAGTVSEAMHERDQAALRLLQSEEHGRTEIVYPPFSAAWKQADGTYRLISPPPSWVEPWQERLLIGFGITVLLILPLAWLLSRRLSRPIIAFSEAAAKVGLEDDSPPVLAVGPREVRAAAEVLNAMQARIRKQIEGRTALMGAIAHDLKTPLARMRLRIETLPDAVRDKLAEDIAHMDGLIRSAMSFTGAHTLRDSLKPLDLSALVETLAEDLALTCPMEPPVIEGHVEVMGDTVALKRIVTNLVENACRYAGGCRIELTVRGREAQLSVIDHGPGLPPDALEMVFEPFYRLEESRSRDTGGTGLGLSVARALAKAQNGALILINRHQGKTVVGLEARLTLPRLAKEARRRVRA